MRERDRYKRPRKISAIRRSLFARTGGLYTGQPQLPVIFWRVPMSQTTNHQFRLAARPVGLPKRSDWNYTEEPVRDPGPSEVLVKNLYISLDPAMRGWMNEIGRAHV